MKSDANCGSSNLLKILPAEILKIAPNDHKLNSEESDMKSTVHVQFVGTRVPNCIRFALRISLFQDTVNFRIFELTKVPHFLTSPITKKCNSLHSNMVANVLIKFGSDRVKTRSRRSVLKFADPYPCRSCVSKNSKSHNIFCFLHIDEKVIAYIPP